MMKEIITQYLFSFAVYILKAKRGISPIPCRIYTYSTAPVNHPYSPTAVLKRLALHPVYQKWNTCFRNAEEQYTGFPTDSCSVKGHSSAHLFKCFIAPYLTGYVLDIGCGPQSIPYYLEDYPLDLMYGIDPLSSPEDHPFNFVQGFCEHLPWDASSFDVVIAATSLDHVMLLEESLQEIQRVLKPKGVFLTWVGFHEGSREYNPSDPALEPLDQYHLFHFDREWYMQILGKKFGLIEHFEILGHAFSAWENSAWENSQ